MVSLKLPCEGSSPLEPTSDAAKASTSFKPSSSQAQASASSSSSGIGVVEEKDLSSFAAFNAQYNKKPSASGGKSAFRYPSESKGPSVISQSSENFTSAPTSHHSSSTMAPTTRSLTKIGEQRLATGITSGKSVAPASQAGPSNDGPKNAEPENAGSEKAGPADSASDQDTDMESQTSGLDHHEDNHHEDASPARNEFVANTPVQITSAHPAQAFAKPGNPEPAKPERSVWLFGRKYALGENDLNGLPFREAEIARNEADMLLGSTSDGPPRKIPVDNREQQARLDAEEPIDVFEIFKNAVPKAALLAQQILPHVDKEKAQEVLDYQRRVNLVASMAPVREKSAPISGQQSRRPEAHPSVETDEDDSPSHRIRGGARPIERNDHGKQFHGTRGKGQADRFEEYPHIAPEELTLGLMRIADQFHDCDFCKIKESFGVSDENILFPSGASMRYCGTCTEKSASAFDFLVSRDKELVFTENGRDDFMGYDAMGTGNNLLDEGDATFFGYDPTELRESATRDNGDDVPFEYDVTNMADDFMRRNHGTEVIGLDPNMGISHGYYVGHAGRAGITPTGRGGTQPGFVDLTDPVFDENGAVKKFDMFSIDTGDEKGPKITIHIEFAPEDILILHTDHYASLRRIVDQVAELRAIPSDSFTLVHNETPLPYDSVLINHKIPHKSTLKVLKKKFFRNQEASVFSGLGFCAGSPWRQIDVTKATICLPCRNERLLIANHTHRSLSMVRLSDEDVRAGYSINCFETLLAELYPTRVAEFRKPEVTRNCMVCLGLARFKCDGCPLAICEDCYVHLKNTCNGDTTSLLYHYDLEHIRNDAFLLRVDGGGAFPLFKDKLLEETRRERAEEQDKAMDEFAATMMSWGNGDAEGDDVMADVDIYDA